MTPPNTEITPSRHIAKVLRRALAAFGPNGEHWSNGYPVKDKSCAWTVCPDEDSARFLLAVGDFNDDALELFRWNDAQGRTFADVKALFEKAILKAEKQP